VWWAMSDARWTPAVFRIAMGEPGKTSPRDAFTHYENVEGETWGAFGINAEGDGPHAPWFVTHLPTGYLLLEAGSRAAARRFCEEVGPLTDWALVQPGRMPPDIKDAVLTARHRARGAMFITPRLVSVRPDDEQEDEPAWPPAPIEGEAIPLPGMDDVPERSAERRYPG
jgi:hypothetical protein